MRLAEFVPDLLGLVGLVLLGAGLWWIWPPLALVMVGLVLLAAGLVAELGLLSRRR